MTTQVSPAVAVITRTDRSRLEEMVRSLGNCGEPFRGQVGETVRELADALGRATVVPPSEMGADVVTMNSRVVAQDLESGRVQTFTLVYHGEPGLFGTRLSVLTPLGVRVLGSRVGDIIEWPVPRGVRRLRIERILYQPGKAGETER